MLPGRFGPVTPKTGPRRPFLVLLTCHMFGQKPNSSHRLHQLRKQRPVSVQNRPASNCEGIVPMVTSPLSRRSVRVLTLGAVAASLLSLAACGSDSKDSAEGTSAGAGLGLNKSGTVSVGYMNGLMPYIGEKSGELTGVDGDLFKKAIEPLDLSISPQGSEFSAMIAAVQSGRLDIGIGGIAWTEEREKAGIFSDPVYYSPLVLLTRPGVDVSTVDDLDGLDIGAVTATLNLEAAQAVPGAKAHTYPDWNKTLADLKAGRIDAASIDPLVVVYAQQNDPDLKDYGVDVIEQPTEEQLAANPKLSAFNQYQVVWYCSKKAKKLCGTLSDQIDEMYANGSSQSILTKWGVEADKFLTGSDLMSEQRAGIDRPEGWTAPSVGK
jgi:ABC-type amino acid transport substrate-binding protein